MRARVVLVIVLIASLAAAAALMFYASDDGGRNDALLFLDRYGPLNVNDPLDVRREQVARLAVLPLPNADVSRVRDVCVQAHRTLIYAEDQSAMARETFERATAGGLEEDEIPTETRAEIENALAESNTALERVREQMPQCDTAVRELERRFPAQRARAPR